MTRLTNQTILIDPDEIKAYTEELVAWAVTKELAPHELAFILRHISALLFEMMDIQITETKTMEMNGTQN